MDHALPHPVPPKIEQAAEAARKHLGKALIAAGYLDPGDVALAAGEVHALVSIAASLRQLVYLAEIDHSVNAASLASAEEGRDIAREGWRQNREMAEASAARLDETLAMLHDNAKKLDLIDQALKSQPQPIPAGLVAAPCSCCRPLGQALDTEELS